MKSLVILLFTLLATILSEGVNLPLQTTSRSGTYTTMITEYQTQPITSVKCSVRPAGSPTSVLFKEEKVEGLFDTVASANKAINDKLQVLYGSIILTRTANEYTYKGYESNGPSVTKKTGNDSNEDFAEWKRYNTTAPEVSTDPGLPCDVPNPAQPDFPSGWVEAADHLSRYKNTTKYYKFSYKISYKIPPPTP